MSQFYFMSSYATECSKYLGTITAGSDEAIALNMVQQISIYSPWYYRYLQMSSEKSEIISAFKKTSNTRLDEIANDIFENLVNNNNLKFQPLNIDKQMDVIFKSLVAIRQSGRFPLSATRIDVSNETIQKFFSNAMVIGGVGVAIGVSSLIVPSIKGTFTDLVFIAGGLSLFGGFITYSAVIETVVQAEDPNKVLSFILSEGTNDKLSTENYFSFDAKENIILGPQYNLRFNEKNEIELYIPKS